MLSHHATLLLLLSPRWLTYYLKKNNIYKNQVELVWYVSLHLLLFALVTFPCICAYSLHGDSRPKAFTWWLVFTIKQKTKILEALQGSARTKRKTCSMNSTDHWEAKDHQKQGHRFKSLSSSRTEVWFTLIFFFCFLASLFRLVSKTDTTWEFATWLSQIIRCDIIHGKFYEMP